MLGILKHLGRSVKPTSLLYCFIRWRYCRNSIDLVHLMEMVYYFISKLEWVDWLIFIECFQTYENADHSQMQQQAKTR